MGRCKPEVKLTSLTAAPHLLRASTRSSSGPYHSWTETLRSPSPSDTMFVSSSGHLPRWAFVGSPCDAERPLPLPVNFEQLSSRNFHAPASASLSSSPHAAARWSCRQPPLTQLTTSESNSLRLWRPYRPWACRLTSSAMTSHLPSIRILDVSGRRWTPLVSCLF